MNINSRTARFLLPLLGIGLLVAGACGGSDEPGPAATSVADQIVSEWLAGMQELKDTLTEFGNPDGSGGSMNDLRVAVSRLTETGIRLSGLTAEELARVQDTHGDEIAQILEVVARRGIAAFEITRNEEIPSLVQTVPGFAISGVSSSANNIPTPTATPAGVAPLPSVDIFVGDVGYRGALAGYCWPTDGMPKEAVYVCADPKQGFFPGEEVLVADGMKPRVVVDSTSPPTRLTANFFADPTMPAIKQIDLMNEANRELDVDFVARGGYYLRIHGEWPEGQADYGFRIVRLPRGDAFTAECTYTEAAPLPITYEVLAEETPTEFDGGNSANCTFSKPVKLINVTLTNGRGSVHSQSFHFDDPRVEIEFPLEDWDGSETTLELLAPVTYTRTMKAASSDDEEWVITDHIDAALDEVTVMESATPTPLPAKE